MPTMETRLPASELNYDDLDFREHYEIVDGRRVEMSPTSAKSSVLANRLARLLCNYGMAQELGEAYSDVLFKLPLPIDRNRRPDVAFVPYSRWPKGRDIPDDNAWNVLPDLCVEVVSPTDLAEEVQEKILEYFQAGVRQVWVIYPRQRMVYSYESSNQVRWLTASGELDCVPVLPGFRLPLIELFPLLPGPLPQQP